MLLLTAAGAVLAQPRGEAVVYDQPDFRGRNYTLRGEVPNFERIGFNDRTSSIRVLSGMWEFCTDANFRGSCRTFGPGEYRDLRQQGDRISSARLVHRPGGGHHARLQLFSGRDFSGASIGFDGSNQNLEKSGFNDRAHSMIIEGGRWRLCSDAYGRGECREFGPGRYATLPHELRSRVSSVFLQ
jgi:hypothetical protein